MSDRLPHGYTNNTTVVAGRVVKTYRGPDASLRRDNEVRALTRFAGVLPVPGYEVVGPDLHLTFLPGSPGQEVLPIAPAEVLAAVGDLARRMHRVAPGQIHGDFGPQNVLIDPGTFEITGVLDWEFAGSGYPVTDLAWAEWIIRTHHPGEIPCLPALHAGYGSTPPWSERHRAMLARCRDLLHFVIRWGGPDGPGARMWRDRIEATEGWVE